MMAAKIVNPSDFWHILKILGAPERCTDFHLHAAVGKPVTITATFYADDLEIHDEEMARQITRHYMLVESSVGADDAER